MSLFDPALVAPGGFDKTISNPWRNGLRIQKTNRKTNKKSPQKWNLDWSFFVCFTTFKAIVLLYVLFIVKIGYFCISKIFVGNKINRLKKNNTYKNYIQMALS